MTTANNWKLGLFVVSGIAIAAGAVYWLEDATGPVSGCVVELRLLGKCRGFKIEVDENETAEQLDRDRRALRAERNRDRRRELDAVVGSR